MLSGPCFFGGGAESSRGLCGATRHPPNAARLSRGCRAFAATAGAGSTIAGRGLVRARGSVYNWAEMEPAPQEH